ncbi:MAG: CCA tRNA nucleotidyltransferase [Candidatus Avispirillum sp.]
MTASEFILPETVKGIIDRLSSHNIAAYPVGGCVRDFLMGRKPGDIDIAAECTPEELKEALSVYRCSFEGFGYGSVSVHCGGEKGEKSEDGDKGESCEKGENSEDGEKGVSCEKSEKGANGEKGTNGENSENISEKIEITCCRREDGYSDGRRPDKVDYTKSIFDDLARRDFTVNAMAYVPHTGEIIDPFGGAEDIRRGVIRCVGDPKRRFGEDALRILRAVRFASVLGFSVEESTARAVHEMKDSLKRLSGARAFEELKKLLSGENVLGVLLEYSDVICTLIPELAASVGFDQHNPHHIYTVYEHTARAVSACPSRGVLRLAMLLHDMAKPYVCTVDSRGIYHFRGHPEEGAKMAEALLRRLGADRECIKEVSLLIRYHDVRPSATRADIRKYLCATGYPAALELLHIRRADLSAQAPEYRVDGARYIDECERLILEAQAEGAPVCAADLAANGADAARAGIPEGPAVGEALERLLLLVSEEKLQNEHGALTAELRRMAADKGNL